MKRYLKAALLLFVAFISTAVFASNPFEASSVTVSESKSTPNTSAHALTPDIATKEGTVVVSSSLNIRTSPWGDVVGTLTNGAKLKIIGTKGDWYKVLHDGKVRYVHSAYVQCGNEKKEILNTAGYVSNCYYLNVRRTPNGDVLSTLKAGDKVEILDRAGDWYKISYGNNEAFVHKNYISVSSSSGTASKPPFNEFSGYVTASTLHVRDGAWGNIKGYLHYGDKVKVIGKEGDWYIALVNGTTRYVHSSYISKNSVVSNKPSQTYAGGGNAGTLQKRIATEARKLIGSTAFRTADVDYGNLACAKVVTTALRNAGALDGVYLNCRTTISKLREKGWRDVSVPPFQEGDVITWKTYDYTGDGVIDPDTHIGIIVKEGNTFKAMNNSSSRRTPRLCDPYAMNVCRVMRKS